MLHNQGKNREALEILDKLAPKFAQQVQGLRLSQILENYGRCLIDAGRFEDAEKEVVADYEMLKTTLEPAHPLVRQSLELIVDLYEAWGKPDKAAEYRALLPESDEAPAKP